MQEIYIHYKDFYGGTLCNFYFVFLVCLVLLVSEINAYSHANSAFSVDF